MTLTVRQAILADLSEVVRLRVALWPDGTQRAHEREVVATLTGKPVTTMPLALFVATADGKLVGFVEVSLRSTVDGCDPRRPSGYLEGWYVDPKQRRRGVGRALIAAAEKWARKQGCREMGSDALIANAVSLRAHRKLGYEVVDRCVNFRKALR